MVSMDVTQRVLLVASVTLVLMVEMINTDIEATLDRISIDVHPLAKKAKDMNGAEALLVLINSIQKWIIILWPLGKR